MTQGRGRWWCCGSYHKLSSHWLLPPPSPNLCSLDYYPTFLSLMRFPSHLHLSLISLPFLAQFFNQCICLHISSFHFLNKESLLLLLLRILISFCWYSFLCPLLSLCATAGSQKMADTFCKLVYSFFCYPPVLCVLCSAWCSFWFDLVANCYYKA